MYSGKLSFSVAILLAFGTIAVSARDCPKACTLEFNQVCATNGEEYRLFDNPCMMNAFNCEHEFLWTQTKSLEPCLGSAQPSESNNINCYKPCTLEYNPVCGFNGEKYQTFGNLCDMYNAHCDDGKEWFVSNFINCEVPQETNEVSEDIRDCVRPCGAEYSPICATYDGEHYELFDNVCDMHNAECGTAKHFKPAAFTACVFLPKSVAPVEEITDCVRPCGTEYSPICATYDGEHYELFDNVCDMHNAECGSAKHFKPAPFTACVFLPKSVAPIEQITDCVRPCGAEYSPICATYDGEHYELFDNVCDMHNAECGTSKHFKPAQFTACVFLPKSVAPVEEITDCVRPCGSEYSPICATYDGEHYELFDNVCDMHNAECGSAKHFKPAPFTACVFLPKSVATIEENCEKPCTFEYNPVCGFNGEEHKTFSNLCVMNNEHCKDHKMWKQTRLDECETETVPASFNAGCEKPCTREYNPTCGFNGVEHKIFSNPCVMSNEHCKDNKNWLQTRMDECETESVPVSFDADCEKPCTREYNPTCGFNGVEHKIFSNPCVMKNEHCKDHKNWVQTRLDECKSESVPASFNAGCEKPCTREYNPTCGFNGVEHKIFSNPCVMSNEHCKDHKNWVQTRLDECKIESIPFALNKNCQTPCTKELNPTCGFNGVEHKIFSNPCVLKNAHCKDNKNWVQTRMDECRTEPVPSSFDAECEKPCTFEYNPVCGFNGEQHKTFPNFCAMENEHCVDHKVWSQTRMDECEAKVEAKKECNMICPFIYLPTCGYNGKSYKVFGNPCEMNVFNCMKNEHFISTLMSECNAHL